MSYVPFLVRAIIAWLSVWSVRVLYVCVCAFVCVLECVYCLSVCVCVCVCVCVWNNNHTCLALWVKESVIVVPFIVTHPCPHTLTHALTHSGKCDCCSMQDIRDNIVSRTKAGMNTLTPSPPSPSSITTHPSHTHSDICGVEFTAGQDVGGGGLGRCGSIVTCVARGQSVYGKVVRFFSYICEQNNGMYAYIEWFRVPDYPMGGTPSVVRVQDTGVVCNIAKVMSICDIDPSRVIIERDDNKHCYYMCRIEGIDTVLRT